MLLTLSPAARTADYGEALVPLADLRLWLRVDGQDEDNLIEALREAAIDMVEQYCGIRMGPVSGLVARFDRFRPELVIGIGPRATLVVTEIAYQDSKGDPLFLSDGDWLFDGFGALVPSGAWPSCGSSVAVTFDVGFPPGTCPSALIQAVRMFVSHLYKNREAVMSGVSAQEVPLGVIHLCNLYRSSPGL
jgi:uncharacterized phiE125 gp8 family phage protein